MAEASITAKALAVDCSTDPKTFRRFLRSHLRDQELETPGQGGRYAFTKSEANALRKAFAQWAAPKVKAETPPEEVEDDEDDEVEELEETDTDDADADAELEDIDLEG